jgi:hypothetical protein
MEAQRMEDPFELIARSVDRETVQAEMDRLDREISERAERKHKLWTLLTLLPPEPVTDRPADDAPTTLTGPTGSTGPAKPTLPDAVLQVMTEGEAGSWWTADNVLVALAQKGWSPGGKTPKNSVASTLSRLFDEGHVVRVDRGLYRLPSATLDGLSAGGARPATLLDNEPKEDS